MEKKPSRGRLFSLCMTFLVIHAKGFGEVDVARDVESFGQRVTGIPDHRIAILRTYLDRHLRHKGHIERQATDHIYKEILVLLILIVLDQVLAQIVQSTDVPT